MHLSLIAVLAAALMMGGTLAEDSHDKHTHSFSQDVDVFHAALAPLWHAPAGKERSASVCAQTQKLESLAGAIHSGEAKPLVAAIKNLQAQCKADSTDIGTAFTQVHQAFHVLVEPKAR
jgi:hypothetical protein